jgi:mono/diheme cytochrome c family protein
MTRPFQKMKGLFVAVIPFAFAAHILNAAEPAKATPEQLEEGKKNYMTVCVACHQPNGAGLPGVFPSIVKSDYVIGSAERLVVQVLKGIQPPFKYNGVTYVQIMIPQEAILTDDKIATILTFVRGSFENNASPITAEFVAGVRKHYVDRKTMLTEVEMNNWKDALPAKP